MALCLDDLVIAGELFNTRWYSVHGYLELKGHDTPLMLQLTGNCSPELMGWHIRFETRDADAQRDAPDLDGLLHQSRRQQIKDLKIAWQQIGPTGPMTAEGFSPGDQGMVDQAVTDGRPTGSPTNDGPPRLHLEWQSQNGHVTLDLLDPLLEFVEFSEIKWGVRKPRPRLATNVEEFDEDALSAGLTGADLEETGEELDLDIPELDSDLEGEPPAEDDTAEYFGEGLDAEADGSWESDDGDDEDEDPYGLFPHDLEQQLESEDAPPAWVTESEGEGDEDTAETIREMELMDDLIENSPGEPVGEIFDRPVRLPLPADMDDTQAEAVLKSLLAELARYGVALDICEHFTPRSAYRLLVEEICKEQRVYPELRQTQWVQQFMTSEFCADCDAEFQREYDEQQRKRRESGEPPDDDIPF